MASMSRRASKGVINAAATATKEVLKSTPDLLVRAVRAASIAKGTVPPGTVLPRGSKFSLVQAPLGTDLASIAIPPLECRCDSLSKAGVHVHNCYECWQRGMVLRPDPKPPTRLARKMRHTRRRRASRRVR